MGGAEFATPTGLTILGVARSMRPARTQQIAIVAAHRGDAGAHQADDCVAKGRGLPRFGGNPVRVEQSFGDRPIAGAGQMPVEGTQGRDQSFASTKGCGRRSGPPMRDEPPEAQCGVGTLWGGRVQWDERGHWCHAVRWANQPELVIGCVISDDQVRTILGVSPDDVIRQIGKRDRRQRGARGRGRQDDDRRQFIGAPEDRRIISAPVWIRQEIATPNAARGHRSRHRLELGRPHRQSDSQDCAAGTPMRGPRDPSRRRIHRRYATANPPSTRTSLLFGGMSDAYGPEGLIYVVGWAACRARVGIKPCPKRINNFPKSRKAGNAPSDGRLTP